MKKLRIGVLVLLACLFLTGCGCSKKEAFTVTFDSNGGSSVESQVVEKGDMVVEPTDPTREGYDFEGWYLGEEEYDFSTEVTKDITLKAEWSQITGGNTDNEEPKQPEKLCKLTCDAGYELVNGDSKECKCQKVSVSSVSLNQTNVTLTVGGSTTVTATINPSNAFDKTMTWKSSDTNVATVKNGTITAVGAGSATITVVASGKTASVTVTVITQDQANLNAALNVLVAKTISNGNTDINYSANGCTITNTANTANDARTVISNGVVTTLYRGLGNGTISSTYTVTCGSLSETKVVNHAVAASGYTYTIEENNQTNQDRFIVSGGATNYTAIVGSSSKAYVESAKSALVFRGTYTKGETYSMYLNSDASTIYALAYAG